MQQILPELLCPLTFPCSLSLLLCPYSAYCIIFLVQTCWVMRSGTKHFGSSPVSLLMGSRRGVRPQSSQQEQKKKKNQKNLLAFIFLCTRQRQAMWSRIANTRHSFCGCVACCCASPPGQTETLFFHLWLSRTLKAISAT